MATQGKRRLKKRRLKEQIAGEERSKGQPHFGKNRRIPGGKKKGRERKPFVSKRIHRPARYGENLEREKEERDGEVNLGNVKNTPS